MAKTRAQQNRKIRQDELRAKLSAGSHLDDVIDIAKQLSEPTTESKDVQRLKAAADIKLKLIDKYLPSMKLVESTGEGGEPIDHKYTVHVVDAKDTDT